MSDTHFTSEGHTVKRFDGEMNRLHLRVLEMGGLALAQLKDALHALKHKDLDLAQKIAPRESQIDLLEVETDADIVGLIARRCPLGGDLRMVMAISKTVTDLERIGDEAIRIANIVHQIYGNDGGTPSEHLLRDVNIMGELAVDALEKSLHAFDELDEFAAEALLETHDKLEEEFEAGLRRLITYVMEDSRNIGFAVSLVLAIKALERIGAHAHNVAEYVIYQVRGKDIRHQHP
ncbi:phosphate signaling complex protein PhoU [Methylomagnum sp.]